MKAGVAFANDASGYVAGRRAAEEAIRKTGALKTPDLVLAFCAGALEANAAFAGIRSAVGARVPILGGSALGVITNDQVSRDGVCVAVLDLGAPVAAVGFADGIQKDERKAGKKLGKLLSEAGPGNAVLVFYDSIRKAAAGATPAVMNASKPLVIGLTEGFPGAPPAVGAGLLCDMGQKPTWQYCGDDARQEHAVGALLGTKVKTIVQVMHGCTPIDNGLHLLTKVKDGIVQLIDGKPAADRIDEIVGSRDWRSQHPVSSFAMGLALGDRLSTLGEDSYVNRLIAGVMPDGKAVALFEPDLEDGSQVLFMRRDPANVLESAKVGAEAAIERMKKQRARPRVALYIDHGGRTAATAGTPTEEAAEIQAVMTREGVTLVGFYSGVGIAPVRGVTRGVDWAGVLLMMGEG
jgi:hypothetical protein